MSTALSVPQGRAAAASPLLNPVFQDYDGPAFGIRFWDSTRWYAHPGQADFVIDVKTEDAWEALSRCPNQLTLGSKYVEGEIDVEGDLYLALRALPEIEKTLRSGRAGVSLRAVAAVLVNRAARFLHSGLAHSQARDAAAVAQHYDKPAEFYELLLGPAMTYSCAYFRSPDDSLEQAQRNKMDLICRKLDLKQGERMLDIGCGWGSLVLHAARNYGVSAYGVSLSQSQVNYARQRIADRQTPHCEVENRDFRDLGGEDGAFAKVASVGMCEHVGERNIDSYFEQAHKLLLPEGLFLNHCITLGPGSVSRGPSFIDQYVFPDGELLPLARLVQAAERAGFEVCDVEDLRRHYEKTLHCWVQNLEDRREQALALTDEKTYRIWKLYMAGSAEAFRRGDIAIHQMLLSKNDHGRSNAATVREAWYRD